MLRRFCRSKAGFISFILSANLFTNCFASEECDCIWQGSFADVQHLKDVVVSGSVLSRKGNSIDLSVERVLRGKTNFQEIRVWLKAKNYCRPDTAEFAIGTHWVMALSKIDKDFPGGFDPNTPSISYGRVDDFILSSCGGYWLKQQGEMVTGNLVNAPRWARDPEMNPVHIDIIQSFLVGEISRDTLVILDKENAALKELLIDTRVFLKNQLREE